MDFDRWILTDGFDRTLKEITIKKNNKK